MNTIKPSVIHQKPEGMACGQTLFLETYGEAGQLTKMTLGSRFEVIIKIHPAQTDSSNIDVLNMFEFYNHYAPLLKHEEQKKGWACFKKAKKQRCDSVNSAFWNYFEGKRIKMVGRKFSVFSWV